jgi:enoyl-CoA hydratase
MSHGDWLVFKKENNIGIIILNHPETFNLVNWDLMREMEEIQAEIENDNSLRCIVIHSHGEHFSAGIDLNCLQGCSSEVMLRNFTWLHRAMGRWQDITIPVIIAVHGYTFGMAVELMLSCDIRIAAKNTRLALPELKFGLSPDQGGTTRLTQLVGSGQAKRIILGAEEISAEEAFSIGLVEIVVENDKLLERAMKLASKIASFPPSGVRFAKAGINVARESSTTASLLFEQAQSAYCCGTADQAEAIKAFLEKRKPERVYTGL